VKEPDQQKNFIDLEEPENLYINQVVHNWEMRLKLKKENVEKTKKQMREILNFQKKQILLKDNHI
jgi:hypothetical protein